MSVKTTVNMSRKGAEALYCALLGRIAFHDVREMIAAYTDEEIGDALDHLSERVADLEGSPCLENYRVQQ